MNVQCDQDGNEGCEMMSTFSIVCREQRCEGKSIENILNKVTHSRRMRYSRPCKARLRTS